VLKTAAAERLAAGQAELDVGLTGVAGTGPLVIVSSQMSYLWGALCTASQVLGFDSVTKGDKVFRDFVLARIIEPAQYGRQPSGLDRGRCRRGVRCHHPQTGSTQPSVVVDLVVVSGCDVAR
jgi:hypothetical protein